MPTRRSFLKLTGASTVAWYVATQTGWVERAIAQIPGGTLDPAAVPKFATPLLIPPVMPRAATITMPGGKPADYYEISMRQFSQQILPAGCRRRRSGGTGRSQVGEQAGGCCIHHAPSLTIEATWKRPVRIKWINDLVDADGDYLPHLLPVDPTLHWANPPGGDAGRDMRPTFASTPGPLHRPGADRDRTCTARPGSATRATATPRPGTCPTPSDIPAGYATEGTWYDFFAGKAGVEVRRRLGPGVRDLPVPERPARVDALVPRPHPGHDPAERVRRPGRASSSSAAAPRATRRSSTAAPAPRPCCPAPRPRKATSSRRTRPTTRSRSRSRTGRSTPTGRCSTRTPARSSTASPAPTSPRPTSRRSGTRSSSAT